MKNDGGILAVLAAAMILAVPAGAQVLTPDGTIRQPGATKPPATPDRVLPEPQVPPVTEPGISAPEGPASAPVPVPSPAAVRGNAIMPSRSTPARASGAPASYDSDEILILGGAGNVGSAKLPARTAAKPAAGAKAVPGKGTPGKATPGKATSGKHVAAGVSASPQLARFQAEGAKQIAACYALAGKAFMASDVYGAAAFMAPDFQHYDDNGKVSGREEAIRLHQVALNAGVRFTSYRFNILRIIWHNRDAEVWVKEDFQVAGQNARAQMTGNAGAYSREFWSLTRGGWKMRQSVVAREGKYMNMNVSPR